MFERSGIGINDPNSSTSAPTRPRTPWILYLLALPAGTIALLPIVYLVVRSTDQGFARFWEILWRDRTLAYTLRSLELATIVTVACLVIGVGCAWLVTRTDIPAKRTLRVLLGLPLALPSYVAAIGWIGWRPELSGRLGSIIVLTTISYPYVYISTMAALRRCDPTLEDVSRSLGVGAFKTFWTVTVPQVRTAAIGGGLLVGLYVLSDFGAVATMRHEVLTTVIFQSYRGAFDRTPPAVLGCVLAGLALLIVGGERLLRRRSASTAKVGSGVPRQQTIMALGWGRWPTLIVALGWLVVALGVPAVGMYQWFGQGSSRPDPTRFLSASVNTLQVGALGAVAVVLIAFPLALLSTRHPGWYSHFAVAGVYAGHALPGVVVGLALVFFGIGVAQPIYQKLPLLILGYAVLFLSLALGSLQNTIEQIPPGLEGMARTLGRSALGAWWAVTARLSAPGIGAAATLVFLTIMKELPTTLFLRPTGFDTLATQLWAHSTSFSRAAAAPYAVAIVVLAALPTALILAVDTDKARPRRSTPTPPMQ